MPATSQDILNLNLFFVRNAVERSEMKTQEKLDVYDPTTRTQIMRVTEPELSGLTKAMRFIGGSHDHGSSFDLIAESVTSHRQLLRISRGSATLTMGGGKVEIEDESIEVIGHLKKLVFAFGTKFRFSERATKETIIIEEKQKLLSGLRTLYVDKTEVATIGKNWQGDHADYFKEQKFTYALSIAPHVPANSRLRQVLIAYGLSFFRIVLRTTIPI